MKIKLSLSMLAAMAVVSGFCSIRAVTPTNWNGKADSWQMVRHQAKLAEIKKSGGAPIVFIGDSITHGWEWSGTPVWKKYFAEGKYRALNLGTSADRTEHVLWRITEGKELDGYEAKVVVLMIGTNNTGHFPFDKEPPVDTFFGIKTIVDTIKVKQPKAKIILTAIFPRGESAKSPYRLRNDIVNREIAKLSDGKRVVWCDFSDKYLDGNGNLSREIFPDLLHPNELGYEIWASSVLPLIDAALRAEPDEVMASLWPSNPHNYLLGEKAAKIAARPVSGYPSIYWWKIGRMLEKRNEIIDRKIDEYDIVFVGDSITHRWERKGGEGVELFEKIKKQYKVLNLGSGGDCTQHVLWRLENGELEGYRGKVFVVMIGTNNCSDSRRRPPEEIAAGVRKIINTIELKHPASKILLIPIIPRGASDKDEYRIVGKKVNGIINKYADGYRVFWCDFNDKLVDKNGDTKWCMNDRLHLNPEGYQIWWTAIEPEIKKLLAK